ncbi:MAG: FAD:protein FMN transferase [Magnetococcus sp. YQC-3]
MKRTAQTALPVRRVALSLGVVVLLGVAFWATTLVQGPQILTTTRMLMGTLVTITVADLPRNQGEQAMQHAFAEMARVEELMSAHRPTSEVSRINQVSRETWIPISAELGQLLQRGLAMSRLSGGAFAMDLQPLTTLWGFSSDRAVSKPPPQEAVQQWLQGYPQTEAIELRTSEESGYAIRLASASVGLDLGGIAKGHAIDRAVAVLRQEGVRNAIVDAGGDLRVLGSKGGKPWRIGIQHPRQPDQVAAISLLQGDLSMATSGDYERFFIHEGTRYHHIMNPATGLSAHSGLSSVTVQNRNGMIIDGLSTAIFVLGAEKGLALLAHFPGCEALLITEEGKPVRTPGFIGEWLEKPVLKQ